MAEQNPTRRSHRFKDLTGQKFTRWTVLKLSHFHNRHTVWICRCDCGEVKPVFSEALLRNRSKSCGCLQKEQFGDRWRTHGLSYVREFKIWRGMISRCQNPRDIGFRDYGGRGIKVCKRWQDPHRFLEDMGICPPNYTLERKDNDGPYSPKNCEWATRKTQNNNNRGNHFLSYRGRTQTITQWADSLGMLPVTLSHRINIWHWPISKALSTPTAKRKPRT